MDICPSVATIVPQREKNTSTHSPTAEHATFHQAGLPSWARQWYTIAVGKPRVGWIDVRRGLWD
jgi:hypothetical protein